ncbi:MAG: glucuronate isomerase [Treponema sp.]|jgi:glucuronate isomerase|nr:glucuronate isomerase [Treponema sp.]
MAKPFMNDENFLLENETARGLYAAAKNEPVYDYHCHLSPAQIAENWQMPDLADAWLSGDHYKWRMMRAMGIDEELITGKAAGYEKYLAWARTVENLIGNPLYHWTHLELQRYFDIHEPLTEESAPAIWEKANALLQKPELSVKGIFEKFKIYAVGTTDDPVDSLEHHRAIAEGTAPIGKIETKVIPSFRPDRALELNTADFSFYIEELSKVSGIKIKNTDDVLAALANRLDFFISLGCRSSDHGLEYAPFMVASKSQIEKIFKRALAGKSVSIGEAEAYKTKMLIYLAKLYAERGIVMQLHLSVIRNINTRLFYSVGANTGFDAVNDTMLSGSLASLLNIMEINGKDSGLPKTILYSLNPKDYYPLATIMGGFQSGNIEGKMQLGSAWWFCDNRDGMEEQMRVLANLGMLPAFVGMLTDSRSFLSYPRHEYFRRIMCNLIGGWVENGEYPNDKTRLEKIVRDISFGNAKKYFG